jgi:hypothetical protein
MLKNSFVLPLLLILGLFFAACNKDTSNPVTSPTVGGIYVQSTPSGAQIWVNGTNSNNVTPDSVSDLSAGNYTVILKLNNYLNDTSTVSVSVGVQTQLNRTLVSDESITSFGPVTVWESGDPSASDPSGIILKSGEANSIAAASNADVDIYYSTPAGLVIATMFDKNGRSTSFFIGTNNFLNDGLSSPTYSSANWTTQISDATTNYFYLYDNDHHYSKMIITSNGNDGHKWLTVRWLYNNRTDDLRF